MLNDIQKRASVGVGRCKRRWKLNGIKIYPNFQIGKYPSIFLNKLEKWRIIALDNYITIEPDFQHQARNYKEMY